MTVQGGKAKAVGADHTARVQDAALADAAAMVHRDVGVKDRIVAHDRALAHIGARVHAGALADDGAGGHRGPGLHHGRGGHLGRRVHVGALTDAAFGQRRAGHHLQRIGKPGVGVLGEHDGTIGPGLAVHGLGVRGRNHQHTGLRRERLVAVLGLRQEGDGVGRGVVQRRKRAHRQIFGAFDGRAREFSLRERVDRGNERINAKHD